MRAKRKKLTFQKWFEAQHGKDPISCQEQYELYLHNIKLGKDSEYMIRASMLYREKMQSARYAWNVFDKPSHGRGR